jgi:hypothetical protein
MRNISNLPGGMLGICAAGVVLDSPPVLIPCGHGPPPPSMLDARRRVRSGIVPGPRVKTFPSCSVAIWGCC